MIHHHHSIWEECIEGMDKETIDELEEVKRLVMIAMLDHENAYNAMRDAQKDGRRFRMGFGEVAAEELIIKLIQKGYW